MFTTFRIKLFHIIVSMTTSPGIIRIIASIIYSILNGSHCFLVLPTQHFLTKPSSITHSIQACCQLYSCCFHSKTSCDKCVKSYPQKLENTLHTTLPSTCLKILPLMYFFGTQHSSITWVKNSTVCLSCSFLKTQQGIL